MGETTMNSSQVGPGVRPVGSIIAGRRFALWMLATCFLCVAGARLVAGNPADVPTTSGGMDRVLRTSR